MYEHASWHACKPACAFEPACVFVCMHVCACAHVCNMYVFMWLYAHCVHEHVCCMHVETKDQHLVSFSIALHLIY